MHRPAVSLLHLSYNQAATIRPAILASLAQSGPPIEIVFSDDASSDDTFAIIQGLVATYRGPNRVILNRNPHNLGIVGNLNLAVSLSSGALLVQANGDDISHPDRVEALHQAWQSGAGRVMLLCSALERIDLAGNVLRPAQPNRVERLDLPLAEIIRRSPYIVGASLAYDRRLFDHFGPLPKAAQVEDHILPFRARALGEIVQLDATLVQWRIGGLSWQDPTAPRDPDARYSGAFLKMMSRITGNFRAYQADCAKLDFPGKDEALAHCARQIARGDYLAEMAQLSALKAASRLPAAFLRSFLTGDSLYRRAALRYSLRPLLQPIQRRLYRRALAKHAAKTSQ